MKIVLPVHHFLPRYTAGSRVVYLSAGQVVAASTATSVEVVSVESISEGRSDQLSGGQRYLRRHSRAPPQLRYFQGRRAAKCGTYDNPLYYEWFREYWQRTTA